MKVIQYSMQTGYDTGSIERSVNETLEKGWELWGNPFDSEGLFCQAMVKYEN